MAHANGTNGNGATLEKDYGHNHLDDSLESGAALDRIRTAGSISISPELFEKIYLSPQNKVAGDLRKTFANPTPIALVGFLLSLTPLSCMLMGWRGAGGAGAANMGAYFFFGGLLMVVGATGEFFLGNTFPCVVFMSFGAFWLTYGATLTPYYNAYGAYSTTGNAADGLTSAGFNASFAFFLLWMGVLCLIYAVVSIRTNIVFFGIFVMLIPSFGLLAAAFWQNALGNTAYGLQLQIAGGACTFVVCMLGWYIFTAIMLASTDIPFSLPVGDLSTLIKGGSEKMKAKQQRYEA
ncbi:GPR1/FUN34/yaaH family-domain-containing protein [Elsinoe ampelina]|uniref:GPR1/FUN34/yaaH family-domain-containing protein n=1 Tax=Elsinoe ampelina TaxID=302913 RepID=A0A6A6GKQ2_9PEZI|nr:GPR1/FUN34/yaaH family-domain-containing protein [Elsinoe ampelina]